MNLKKDYKVALDGFREEVFFAHKQVRQKYGGSFKFPYSVHLKFVESQHQKFKILLTKEERIVADFAIIAHDTLEDVRWTYNDLREKLSLYVKDETMYGEEQFTEAVAEVVYRVTDEKGRNRAERKSEKYYKELADNHIALYVKLCDMLANRYFSALTNSPMLNKYREEFLAFESKCHNERFDLMFKTLSAI